MDTMTHGILGAVVANACLKKNSSRLLVVAGSLAAMAPDLDFLIQSKSNPLLLLEYHRHFTHSFIFIPLGGFLIALIFWLLSKRKIPFQSLFLISMLGYATHSLLDSCTSYGTMILWPFSRSRISWDLIAIIDLFFSFTLIAGLIFSRIFKSKKPVICSLLIVSTYLLFGFFQRQSGLQIQEQIASQRHQQIEQGRVTPTLTNLFLWRSVYKSDGRIYSDAIWANPFGKSQYWTGGSLPEFQLPSMINFLPPTSVLRQNLLLYDWFSDRYLALLNENPMQIGDLRYSLQPQGNRPLWGIEFDPEKPDQPARRIRFDENRKEMLKSFWRMLSGKFPGGEEIK